MARRKTGSQVDMFAALLMARLRRHGWKEDGIMMGQPAWLSPTGERIPQMQALDRAKGLPEEPTEGVMP